MKIEYSFGPHAGETDHIPDNALAALLVKSGVLKVVEDFPSTRPLHPSNANNAAKSFHTEPKFFAGESKFGAPIIYLNIGSTQYMYGGAPEQAAAHFKQMGFDLPQDEARHYGQLYAVWKNKEAQAELDQNRRNDLAANMQRAASGSPQRIKVAE
jgi:hypothetical protein